MLKLEDVNAIGEALVQNVSDLQERFDVMVDENAKVIKRQLRCKAATFPLSCTIPLDDDNHTLIYGIL